MNRMITVITGLLIIIGITACSGSKETDVEVGETADNAAKVSLHLIFGELTVEKPVGLEHRDDQPDLLYVIEQPGRIVSMNVKKPADKPRTILDITDRVHGEGPEQGLLGLAFHPDRSTEAYVNYTTETHTVIARYVADSTERGVLDPDSEQVLLTFEQPYANHNGGQLAFGPDGYLYIATGDGGNGGDPHNNGQNLESLLGKILRIDVDKQQGNRAYAIPSDNPFRNGGAPEIYAYGLRNPWRFSFDPDTGQLWAADVGQNSYEEINIVQKGKNYGWSIQEGTECFKPKNGCDKTGLEQPIFTYGREQGVSITGGFVYRGRQLPELKGQYVYGDYGSGTIWALSRSDSGTARNQILIESKLNITSFGVDVGGEMYVCDQGGKIFQLRPLE
jgi:glucose/arabinose dehydrogenase